MSTYTEVEREQKNYDWRKIFFFLEHLREEGEISENSFKSLIEALQTFKPEMEE